MNIKFCILLSIVLTACSERKTRIKETSLKDSISNIVNEGDINIDTIVRKSYLNYDIEVSEIKKQIDGVTSGYVPKGSDYLNEEDLSSDDFVGFYYLILNDEYETPAVLIGKLIVFNSEKPWLQDNNSDKFLEISLWGKGISLLDNKIKIGIDKDSLIRVLGQNFETQDDVIIFKGEKLTCLFKIKDNVVSYLKIGNYKNNIDYNLIIEKMAR